MDQVAATPRTAAIRIAAAVAVGFVVLIAAVAIIRPDMMMTPIHRMATALGWFG